MKFCTSCGKAVSIFDTTDVELCRKCSVKENQTVVPGNANNIDLNGATFSAENGKLLLKSKEGWLLWSGSANELHSFQAISEKAKRILKIRRKKKSTS